MDYCCVILVGHCRIEGQKRALTPTHTHSVKSQRPTTMAPPSLLMNDHSLLEPYLPLRQINSLSPWKPGISSFRLVNSSSTAYSIKNDTIWAAWQNSSSLATWVANPYGQHQAHWLFLTPYLLGLIVHVQPDKQTRLTILKCTWNSSTYSILLCILLLLFLFVIVNRSTV